MKPTGYLFFAPTSDLHSTTPVSKWPSMNVAARESSEQTTVPHNNIPKLKGQSLHENNVA